jgi:isopentenyl-diphosphate delta-isomerase
MLHLLLQAQLLPALKLPPRCLLQHLKAAAAHPQPLPSASCSHPLAVSAPEAVPLAVLLQRRAESKYHCGGMWANTCCTHPYWNESEAASAERRLREEMGLSLDLKAGAVIEYSAAVSDGLWENERVQIFHARVDRRKTVPILNPEEVSHARWASVSSIRADMVRDPGAYAPWFRIYMARWSELGL